MDEDKLNEHPLDSLLDIESGDEFGHPEIRDRSDHQADKTVSGNLKEWSAQEFASIYIRFRPHLERHAKRYISNPVQAEEIVQDAFLYLMTTLPEMDSELGVLKFLKWKIKLLCFDVLRSSAMQRETPFPDFLEHVSEEAEFTADFERAEDNAVIRIALARLNPRQREALIANVYEEKTTEEVAEQLNLSPNAARQLLFRARSAFRKALVGEVEIQGKTIGQVLTIAAKKAALDAKENATKVGAFIVLASLAIGVLPSLFQSNESIVANSLLVEIAAQEGKSVPAPSTRSETRSGVLETGSSTELKSTSESVAVVETAKVATVSEPKQSSTQASLTISTTSANQNLTDQSLSDILGTNVENAGIYTTSDKGPFGIPYQGVVVEVFGGTGISAFIDLNTETKSVSQTIFQMSIDSQRYFGIARVNDSETLDNGNGYTLAIVSKEFYVVDEQGSVFSESPLADSKSVVTLELAEDGTPQSASLKVESDR